MDAEKVPVSKYAIILGVIIVLVIIVYMANFLARSESISVVTTKPVRYSNPNVTSAGTIWAKTVKTTSGLSLLKCEGYDAMSINMFPMVYWESTQMHSGWFTYIMVVGFGATRSDYGLVRGNGLKTIVMDIDEGKDVRTLTYVGMNLHGATYLISDMLAAAGNQTGVEWPSYTEDMIYASASHPVMFYPDTRRDSASGRFITTIQKWQYSDPVGGDGTDAIFATELRTGFPPGQTSTVRYIANFYWSLLDHSKNEMTLTVSLPPNPETLTQQDLEKYNISVKPYTENGQTTYQYYIANLTCQVV